MTFLSTSRMFIIGGELARALLGANCKIKVLVQASPKVLNLILVRLHFVCGEVVVASVLPLLRLGRQETASLGLTSTC